MALDEADRGRYANLSTEDDAVSPQGSREEGPALLPASSEGLPRPGTLGGGSASSTAPPGPATPGEGGEEGLAEEEVSDMPIATPPPPSASLSPPARRSRWWLVPVLFTAASPFVAFGAIGVHHLLHRPRAACGGPLACGNCLLRPAPPFWIWRCGRCSLGYRLLRSGACAANRCACHGGVPATGERCRSDGEQICSACGVGYHRAGRLCAENRCTCQGGKVPKAGGCTEDGAEQCRGCNRGFHLDGNICVENRCKPGFHLVMQNFTCTPNVCYCHNGSAVMGAECSKDGAERCGSCNSGFHLAVGLCWENRCVCRGGMAPRGMACVRDGAWRCTSCSDGFHRLGERCDPVIRVLFSAAFAPENMGAPDILADLHALGHSAQTFDGRSETDWATRHVGVLLVPELTQPLELSAAARGGLKGWIQRGGHLLVCGDYFGHNGRFMNALFGWSLQGVLCSQGPARGSSCGILCGGPERLEWNPEVSCYASGLLPPGAQSAYGDGGAACVFTAEWGGGRVTYLGFDWYNTTRRNWMKVLNLAVLGSG